MTGQTGILARTIHLFATTTAEQILQLGKQAALVETASFGPPGNSVTRDK
jgi:hypothetical protein